MATLPRLVFLDAKEVDVERQALEGICEVSALNLSSAADIPEWIQDVEYIGLWHTVFLTEDVIQKLKSCKLIVRMGVGYDNVHLKAAGEANIPVVNIPAYGTEEVADTALALILALYRQTHTMALRVGGGAVIHGGDEIAKEAYRARRMRGSTLGILGLGAIGSALALRAKALGMSVIFFDPYVSDGMAKALGVRRAETLTELATSSQCVSVHCLLNKETHHIINAEFLANMAPGSFVVNTARGAVIDEVALLAAIQSGHIGGAGLDVFEVEPFDASKNPLARFDNVICCPHIAWFSQESRHEMRVTAAKAVDNMIAGKPIRNIVNAHLLPAKA